MIVILKQQTNGEQIDEMVKWLSSFDVKVNLVQGTQKTILGLIA